MGDFTMLIIGTGIMNDFISLLYVLLLIWAGGSLFFLIKILIMDIINYRNNLNKEEDKKNG